MSLQLGAYRTDTGSTAHLAAGAGGALELRAQTANGNWHATLVPCGKTPSGRHMWQMQGHPLGGVLSDHPEEHALFEFGAPGEAKPRSIWKFQGMAAGSVALEPQSPQLGTYRAESGATATIAAGSAGHAFHAHTRNGNWQATLVPSGKTPSGRNMWEMQGHPLGGFLTEHSDENALYEFAAHGDPKPRTIWRFQSAAAGTGGPAAGHEAQAHGAGPFSNHGPHGALCQAELQYHHSPQWSDPTCGRRRQVLRETVNAFETRKGHFHSCAVANLDRWRREARQPPVDSTKPVVVYQGDWGETTLDLTQRFGQRFAVLNMANQELAGGYYLLGILAQEEDMFRRTDCHFHVTADECDMSTGRYLPHVQSLISGSSGSVPLDMRSPRVCIRGREVKGNPDLGFPWLPENEVFDFYELRSAALDLRDGRPFDALQTRQKIAAQLDTLIRAHVRHVVLSAFGCGAFQNPPLEVARVYEEEIRARLGCFDCVAFAIMGSNYEPFRTVLAPLVSSS